MVTPWLMLKFGKAHAGGHGHDAADGGPLGRMYRRVAAPILASRRRAGMFLLAVVVATFASMGLFYTKAVTVKLLPFDSLERNKNAAHGMSTLPAIVSIKS